MRFTGLGTTKLGRDVALKVLPAAYASDPERLRRFEQEARAVGALNHPNILTVHDVGVEGGAPYIVTELLEGETLREALVRGGAQPAAGGGAGGRSWRWVLAAAHAKGDGSPGREAGERVPDAGRACEGSGLRPGEAAGGGGGAGGADDGRRWRREPGVSDGDGWGTCRPEQLRGQGVDARSDVFALGVVLLRDAGGALSVPPGLGGGRW